MTSNHVAESVRRVFLEELNIQVRSDDTDLIETGVIDSLILVELLFEIERAFDLSFELEELEVENFRTLRSIGAFITAHAPA